ncbi:MAG: DNA-3-methyladenine glycosylase I [Motiliproteus sp.]|jgi:DNA-3-methyladenine glycosylase I
MSLARIQRCDWCDASLLYQQYHDLEWGVPLHDDQQLFEFLILEGAQAGLSWITILNKREHYRRVYDNFDPVLVAGYDVDKVEALLADPGIVRNRLKVRSSITNAQAFLSVQAEFGSFDRYLWAFVGGSPRINGWKTMAEIPVSTAESEALSKALKKRGFKFVGPTICYALMQATGMVNDHLLGCHLSPQQPKS